MEINIGIIAIIVLAIAILAILASGYVKASPNKAYIISGIKREPKVLIGRAGIKIPFLEKKDELILKQISIDIKTNGYIPTKDFIGVDIDAVAKVRVLTQRDVTVNAKGEVVAGADANKRITTEMANAAMKNFLNMNEDQIRDALTDSLQGNMREIIGTQCLKELCNDRKTFGDEVQAKAQKDMNALGIWIESCNIQKIEDENNLITALGQDNMSQIQKDASVAKAQADRDVAIARAQAQKDANDAQVIAETEIAQKQTELAIKKAELKKESDIKKAEADAAYKIQEEEQRKTVEITTANANLARQEKELELKEREVSIKEKALEAEVKKTAEANKYAAQQKADAEQYERQKRAEAELFEIQRQAEAEKAKSEAERFAKEQAAEAVKAAGLAEAAAVAAKGKAEAEAIQAKAEAEAAGILKKAEAMKQYGDAARQQMELDTLKVYFEQLPKIAEAVAKGYMNVDSIKMFGGDSSKLAGDIMTTVTQVTDGIKESTGLDINEMLEHVGKNTILVACMMVNNEVGTRNDVERLAAEVKRRNSRTIVHVDAVQAWMRVPIKLDNIDTLAVSGHKIHAPKGIGALYLSDRLVQAFQPPYLGGEQERGLRPGTENLPYAMGLAAAAARLAKTMKSRDTAMRALNQRLRDGLAAFPEVVLNSPADAVPEVLNFSENCIKSETMLAFLAEAQIYVSSASACGRGQPSHTLAAMGRDPLAIDTAIRVSFCADNTPEDVDAFLNRFEDGMKHLQRIRK